MNYYRVFMKGLYVGIGVRADRLEISGPTVFFWSDGGPMVASFWLEDIIRIQDGNDVAIPLAA